MAGHCATPMPACASALLEKLRFAAGRERVQTFDAQTLAEDFLGDTIVANIVASRLRLAARPGAGWA